MDEFLWGAAWLRRATQDENFLNYIQSNGKTLGAEDNINEFGWENKHVGLNVLVFKEVLDGNVESLESYKTSAESFLCTLIPETSSLHIEYTPGGLIYRPGATVGGPGEDDVYGDDRADLRKSEPTTYINASLLRLRKTKNGLQRLRQDLHALRFIKLMNAIDPEF